MIYTFRTGAALLPQVMIVNDLYQRHTVDDLHVSRLARDSTVSDDCQGLEVSR